MAKSSRGIRNNNPGNIEDNGTPWQGLASPRNDGRFCRFTAPVWGIRAMARTLISYQDKHQRNTVRKIINRWAPSSENNTDAYIASVVARTEFGPDAVLDMHSYEHAEPLVRAIIFHENAQDPYDQTTVDEGLRLAGVKGPLKPLTKSKELGSAGVAGVAGVEETVRNGADVVEGVATAQAHISTGTWIGLACGVALILVTLVLVRNRLKARKAGIR